MLEVELDQSDDWNGDQNWQNLANAAVMAAFAVAGYHPDPNISISISLSDNATVHGLNLEWRGKDQPTNVLSFPMLEVEELATHLSPLLFRGEDGGGRGPDSAAFADKPHPSPSPEGEGLDREILLGDMILARETCVSEAQEKAIPLADHVSHLIVHGTLHLLGLDHIDDGEAEQMEALEVKALASLGLANPYSDDPTQTEAAKPI